MHYCLKGRKNVIFFIVAKKFHSGKRILFLASNHMPSPYLMQRYFRKIKFKILFFKSIFPYHNYNHSRYMTLLKPPCLFHFWNFHNYTLLAPACLSERSGYNNFLTHSNFQSYVCMLDLLLLSVSISRKKLKGCANMGWK